MCHRLLLLPVSFALTALVALSPAAGQPEELQDQAQASQPTGDAPSPTTKPTVPRYNLRELVEMARADYPGVEAARHAIAAMEQDLFRARWAWLPQGKIEGLLAPAPKLECFNFEGDRDRTRCVQTTSADVNSFDIAGVLARIRLELGMPLYTFGKLSAAKRAAQAGVTIQRSQLARSQDKVALDVTKAYWGLKLAREILYTINDGMKHLVDAQEKIEEDLDEGEGEYTVTDLLRLKTAHAEVNVRIPEAHKLEKMALAALAILIGKEVGSFDVDTEIISLMEGEPLSLETYLELSQAHRPELELLRAAVQASKASVDLERARLLPSFLLVGMFTYAYTSSADNPENAFYNDPFNSLSAGIGLAMNWKFDHVLQWGSYRKARATSQKVAAQQREGRRGVRLDITKAYQDLVEARERLEAASGGERQARRWLAATSQNMAAGLAETRDLTDALLAYFQMRLKHLQAIYDVNVGWSELGRAIGTRPPQQDR